jgi:hypothetical protein
MSKFDAIKTVIADAISEIIELPASEIQSDVDLGEYGVNSLLSAIIAEKLNRYFGEEVVDLALLADFSTIDEVASYLSELVPEGKQLHCV